MKKVNNKRGWPVVATGMPERKNINQYRSWRGKLQLPDESPWFSDRDVFDVIEVIYQKREIKKEKNEYGLPNIIVQAMQQGLEKVPEEDIQKFVNKQKRKNRK